MEREKQLKNIYNCRNKIKTVLMLNGIWPKKNRGIFDILHAYVVCAGIFIIFFAVLNFIYHHRHSLIIVLKGLSLCLSLTCVLSKLISFMYYRTTLRKVEDTLMEILNEQLKKNDEKLISKMLSPIDYFVRNVSMGIFFFGYGIMTALYMMPIMSIVKQHRANVYPIKYTLPYPTVYPWPVIGGSPVWIGHFVFESIMSFLFCSIGTSTDNTFGYYCSHIMGQFRALNYEITNLVIDEHYKERTKDIVVRHRKLVYCCELLETVSGISVIVICITAALILCCLIYQTSQMKEISTGQILWITVYICYKLTQTLIYAWAGDKIRDETEKFREAIYACAWETSHNKSFAQYVLIMMNQRPINLSACGIMAVDAKLFLSVLNTSLSYFFLLKSLDEKK